MMKPSYTFLDHTADVLFQAQAPTLNQLFEQCALAVEETQVEIQKLEPKKTVTFSLEAKNVESLLFQFLDELLFYKDAEQVLFSQFQVRIKKNAGKFLLTCRAQGELLDVQKHQPKVDVKAITMHLFEVEKISRGWKAQVLIDI